MRQRIENAVYEALEARRRADECMNIQIRDQWLVVATEWDGVVITFGRIEKLRDAALAAEVVLAAKNAQSRLDPRL